MKIEDNFLEQKVFDELQTLMMGKNFTWYFRSRYYAQQQEEEVVKEEDVLDQFQFIHTFYIGYTWHSQSIFITEPFLAILQPLAIYRIRANLLTRLPNIVENPFHSDLTELSEEKQKQWTTSIFYVNTNDGYTEFEDGTKVESVANRMLTFPAHMKHRGTTCTDEKTRVVINFNYFK